MHRYVPFRFSGAFRDNPGVAGRAVVARHFCDQMVGAFIHNGCERVRAQRAFVSRRRSRFHFCRRAAFCQSDQGLRAFFGVGNGSKRECDRAEARDEEGFAIDCFHIRFFLFSFFSLGPLGPHL